MSPPIARSGARSGDRSGDRSSEPSKSVATDPHVTHRVERLAVALGLASILVAAVIGWSAYNVSQRRLLEGYREDVLGHARALAESLNSKAIESFDPQTLACLEAQFARQERAWPGSHLCAIDDLGVLLLDTANPSRVGQFVGDSPFVARDERGSKPATFSDLLASLKAGDVGGDAAVQGKDSWIGKYESLEGQTQLAAFVYVPRPAGLVAIHVPWSDVARQIDQTTLPWALGLGLIVLLAIPLSLWGLSKAYADTERGARQAREAERRSADQIRILRDIDRAILAGGSVEEIVRAALAGMEPLIRFHRASVALFVEKNRVVRILVVQSSAETKVGAGTEVPVEQLSFLILDDLRAGRALIIPDLDARSDLPPFMTRLRTEGVRSTAILPLACRGELLGTLNVSFDHVGEPSDEDLELGGEVADVLALAVLQGQLRERLEQQAAELEQRVAERTQQLSDVNAELEGYVRSVSHDLRAPLRAVHGFGNLLLEEAGGKLGKTEREYLERMVSASGRMNALVRDLLAYSRLAREDVEIQPLDLQHVVEEARDLLQADLEERGADLEIVGPIHSVVGHHSSLVQAVANLLSNAAKFVAPGVRPRVRVRSERRGDRVRLWVEDNGIGISALELEKVFLMFERLNGAESYPGSGIGLAIVRRTIERMGGTTGVESQPGEGSRFWIELRGAEAR